MDKRTLIIAASFLGVSVAMFFLMVAIVKNFLATKKKVFIYVIVTFVSFSLVALLGYDDLISNPNIQLIVFQICLFGLGILHSWALYAYMDWDESEFFSPDIFFSLFIWVIGMLPFYLIYVSITGLPSYQYYMLGGSLFFIIPIFVKKTFLTALSMPKPEIESWFYPIHTKVPDPQAHELKNPFVITFVLNKEEGDTDPISFRAKAPEAMKMGRLFYYFMEDYNDQHVESRLAYTDKLGHPYGWNFYFQPEWYLLFSKRYINPDKTIKENKIQEDTVIICERAEVLEEDEIKVLEGKVSSY